MSANENVGSGRQALRVFWRAVRNAALDRINLVVSGAVAASGMILQAPGLFAVAAAGYVLAIAADFGRNPHWRRATIEVRCLPPPLPVPSDYRDTTARELLIRLERARDERKRFCPAGRKAVDCTATLDVAQRAAVLEEMALKELVLFDQIATYLGDHPLEPLRSEEARLSRLALEAPTTAAKEEYLGAQNHLRQRADALEQMEACRAFLQARLENAVGLLEVVPHELLRVDVGHAVHRVQHQEALVADLADELQTLKESTVLVLMSSPPSDAQVVHPPRP